MRALLYQLREGFRSALSAVRQNKMRALLTTLGIVIGIVMVTSTFTTINGMERAFDRSLAMLGTNALYVQRTPAFIPPSEWWKYERRPEFTRAEMDRYAEEVNTRAAFSEGAAVLTGGMGRITYGDATASGVMIRASTGDIVRVAGIELDAGRFYTDLDNAAARFVVVIGKDVQDALFPTENPIGKHIRINGQRFEVIGVLAKQGKFLGLESFDNQVQMPINTFERMFGQTGYALQVRAKDGPSIPKAEDELIGIGRTVRGLDAREDDNFSVARIDALRDMVAATKATIYGVGLFLTALALVVGGIGVMNIMFVSVKERTREIGIRKALGAPRRAILLQFLLEAVVVCLIGGAIGIGLSVGVTALINRVFTAALSPGIVVLAFTICVLVGLTFGLLPAWRASRANPIEALRYE
ncbi:MAG: ABC transporter permease [Bacteroidetes bacterium]|nr:ABC transporter permease [Bacteroidota bacterium]